MNYIDNLFKLEGKVALITGGGGVLAGAIGSGLAQAGAKIILADINLEKAVANAETITSKNCSAYGLYMDALDTLVASNTTTLDTALDASAILLTDGQTEYDAHDVAYTAVLDLLASRACARIARAGAKASAG